MKLALTKKPHRKLLVIKRAYLEGRLADEIQLKQPGTCMELYAILYGINSRKHG